MHRISVILLHFSQDSAKIMTEYLYFVGNVQTENKL